VAAQPDCDTPVVINGIERSGRNLGEGIRLDDSRRYQTGPYGTRFMPATELEAFEMERHCGPSKSSAGALTGSRLQGTSTSHEFHQRF